MQRACALAAQDRHRLGPAGEESSPLTPVRDPSKSRISRLRAFEILIFVLMAILLALCLAAVPAVSKKDMTSSSPESTPWPEQ
jgi:hypothetical protein